ncbi:MAG: hypothetical protein JJE03_07870 [Peptostreptococcaceae bacterium]|nr:hypothetical protein [Peptostreptococcaceae bacterium]
MKRNQSVTLLLGIKHEVKVLDELIKGAEAISLFCRINTSQLLSMKIYPKVTRYCT